jgi:hypothetical protein
MAFSGTLVMHGARFTQADFSVKVRCHNKKCGVDCGKLSVSWPSGLTVEKCSLRPGEVSESKSMRARISGQESTPE